MSITEALAGTQKLYALQRMRVAIDRAIKANTSFEKERAARWAGAWGTAGGIPPAAQWVTKDKPASVSEPVGPAQWALDSAVGSQNPSASDHSAAA